MHREAYEFVARTLRTVDPPTEVVDLGGQDVNSTARGMSIKALFPPETRYTTVDIVDGPDVNVVGPAQTYRHPYPCDMVICTELLEHTPDGKAIIQNAYDNLVPEGVLLLTCATDPRAPHSAWGDPSPREHEYYGNVKYEHLKSWLGQAGFSEFTVWVNLVHADLYVKAIK